MKDATGRPDHCWLAPLQLVKAFQERGGQANLPSQAVYQLSIKPGQLGPPARPGLAAMMATVMMRQVPQRVLRVRRCAGHDKIWAWHPLGMAHTLPQQPSGCGCVVHPCWGRW
jgi:hypothetical protein